MHKKLFFNLRHVIMKKYVFLLLLLCFFSINYWEAKTTAVFDSCGTGEKYQSYTRFDSLSKELMKKWLVSETKELYPWDDGVISEMCYSKQNNQVIINVPRMKTQNTKKLCKNGTEDVQCTVTANVYSYDIKTNTLSKAERDSRTIYEGIKEIDKTEAILPHKKNKLQLFTWNDYYQWFEHASIISTIFWFWKREKNFIWMQSGYGDAWCITTIKRKYFYQLNLISAFSQTSKCEGQNQEIMYFWK